MSSVVYGTVTRKREEAEPGTSDGGSPPGVKSYVDVLTALVPAEVLAAFAVLLPVFTSTTSEPSTEESESQAVVAVTDLTALRLAFWLLALASVILYLVGRAKQFDWWDLARMLIPPLAFVGWVMLQQPIVFGAVGPAWSTAVRTVIAVVGALLLSAVATALAYKADETPVREEET
jgi:hypothetical protein